MPHPHRRRRWPRVALVLVVVALLAGCGIAVDALRVPGPDSAAAKLAEWGRSHGFNPEITWLEKQLYMQSPPAIGGLPPGGIPSAEGTVPHTAPSTALSAVPLPPLSG